QTLSNLLAIVIPIAWQMLLLRHYSRNDELKECPPILTPTQMAIVLALNRGKIPEHPTAKKVLYAIAQLGGHIKNNGAPGWIVIYRGMRELHSMEKGIQAISKAAESDMDAMRYVINV